MRLLLLLISTNISILTSFPVFKNNFQQDHSCCQERRGTQQAPRRSHHRVRRCPPQHPRRPPPRSCLSAKVSGLEGLDVVFLQTLGQGHINPTIPLVKALTDENVNVSYFADHQGPPGLDYVNSDSPLGAAVLAAGGKLRTYRNCDELRGEPRLEGMLNSRWLRLPALVEDLRSLSPSVCLYDPFNPVFPAAARIVGCEHVAIIPHSGPGTMAALETEVHREKSRGVREWLLETYEIDLFDLGLPASSWYSQSLNLVLTNSALYSGLSTPAQKSQWSPESFHCVGTLYERDSDLHPKQEDFQMEQIIKGEGGNIRCQRLRKRCCESMASLCC